MVRAKPIPVGLDQGLVTEAHTDTNYVIEAQVLQDLNMFSGKPGNAIRNEHIVTDHENGRMADLFLAFEGFVPSQGGTVVTPPAATATSSQKGGPKTKLDGMNGPLH